MFPRESLAKMQVFKYWTEFVRIKAWLGAATEGGCNGFYRVLFEKNPLDTDCIGLRVSCVSVTPLYFLRFDRGYGT